MEHETLPKIRVGKSSIHGTGVYACEDIKKGQKIIEYVGEKIPSDEGTRRSEAHPELTYIFYLNKKWDIDGSVGGNDSRFINHSCDPNAEIDIIDDRIWIMAYKDIKEDDELTFDYSLDADEKCQCNCGAKNCRGVLNAPDDDDEWEYYDDNESEKKKE